MKFELNQLVKYEKEDTLVEKLTGYYPPKGTTGKILDFDSDGFVLVLWEEGTTKPGAWWTDINDIAAE